MRARIGVAIALLLLGIVIGALRLLRSQPGEALRQELRSALHSLPPTPEGVVLLSQVAGTDEGADCRAYFVERVYGTNRPLAEVLGQYDAGLAQRGWTAPHGFDPDAAEAAAYERGKGQLVVFLTSRHQHFAAAVRGVGSERLAAYSTVFVLQVVGMGCAGPLE